MPMPIPTQKPAQTLNDAKRDLDATTRDIAIIESILNLMPREQSQDRGVHLERRRTVIYQFTEGVKAADLGGDNETLSFKSAGQREVFLEQNPTLAFQRCHRGDDPILRIVPDSGFRIVELPKQSVKEATLSIIDERITRARVNGKDEAADWMEGLRQTLIRFMPMVLVCALLTGCEVKATVDSKPVKEPTEFPATVFTLPGENRCHILVIDQHFYLVHRDGGLLEIPPILNVELR